MGGLFSSIFDLSAGDPATREEHLLSDLGGYETGIGKAGTTADLNYDLGILSGDPTKVAETLAPEISTQQQLEQQGKNALAEFSPRSGGTAAAAADMDSKARGNIINLVGSERSGAAHDAGALGTNNLSMASGNISNVADRKTARQKQVEGDWGQIGQAAAEIATAGMTGGMGGAGADPYQTLYAAQHPDPNALQMTPDNSLDSFQF